MYPPARMSERTWHEFECLERGLQPGITKREAIAARRPEAEARIVPGVTEHHDNIPSAGAAFFEPGLNERGAEAATLPSGQHREWRKTTKKGFVAAIDGDGGE